MVVVGGLPESPLQLLPQRSRPHVPGIRTRSFEGSPANTGTVGRKLQKIGDQLQKWSQVWFWAYRHPGGYGIRGSVPLADGLSSLSNFFARILALRSLVFIKFPAPSDLGIFPHEFQSFCIASLAWHHWRPSGAATSRLLVRILLERGTVLLSCLLWIPSAFPPFGWRNLNLKWRKCCMTGHGGHAFELIGGPRLRCCRFWVAKVKWNWLSVNCNCILRSKLSIAKPASKKWTRRLDHNTLQWQTVDYYGMLWYLLRLIHWIGWWNWWLFSDSLAMGAFKERTGPCLVAQMKSPVTSGTCSLEATNTLIESDSKHRGFPSGVLAMQRSGNDAAGR